MTRASHPTLTEADLARETASTVERIQQLVSIGVLVPTAEGGFAPADVQRVQIIGAYEAGGIGLEFIEQAIREERMSFAFTDRLYPVPSPRSGRTVADLEAELGRPGAIGRLYLAMGLAQPEPGRELTMDDEALIRSCFGAWGNLDNGETAMLRAARMVGDGIRRMVVGWVGLFHETVAVPPEEAADLTLDEFLPRVIQPGMRVAQLMEPLAIWLLHRHLERELNAMNVETMEDTLEVRGLRPRAVPDPPAVVFADLSGFTRLTEELGDEGAATYASRLTALAVDAAGAADGRVVKELGDGVMLVFPGVRPALASVLRLRDTARADHLPPLHVGVSAGPLIERDGDVYGRSVNLAARLSAAVDADEILLSAEVAELASPHAAVAAGERVFKGLDQPVAVYRLSVDSQPSPP